ncbi:MAG: hypothetical protein WCI72_01675 [archaeon]
MLDDIAEYNKEFEREKARVNGILAKGGDFPNDGKVDSEMRDLISNLNALPFLYSWSSCSGHFLTREDIFQRVGHRNERLLQLPIEGHGFYFDGYLGLAFRPSTYTGECISGITQIVERYPSTSIDPWKPLIDTNLGELQGLRFEIKLDSTQRGHPAVIPIKEGTKLRRVVNELIGDLNILFSRYNSISQSE